MSLIYFITAINDIKYLYEEQANYTQSRLP